MTKSIEYLVYLLLIFLLPTQLGKHFWPSFSLIGGLRVDYLSPTLYATDFLIIILGIVCVYRWMFYKRKNYELRITNYGFSKRNILIGLFLLVLLVGTVFAKNQPIAVYGLFKLLEMAFFAWYTSRVIGKTISLQAVAWALGLGVFMESSLAIAQFFSKGSLGGLWYFFGERTFSSITPGIANASIQGQLMLRPYGTLPHPNVLAGYLLIAMIFLTSQWDFFKNKNRWFLCSVLLLGTFGLFLTLSRTTILLFVLLFIPALLMFVKDRRTRFVAGGLGVVGIVGTIGTIILSRFQSLSFLEESFVVRSDLLQNAWWMVSNHPLFGVGLMNFLVRLPSYQHAQSFYLHLQPVHNIFALMAAEVGILGFLGILGFFILTVKHIWRAAHTPLRLACLLMLFSIFFLGMFDHYFVTLQSGQLLFAFVLGVCYSLPKQKKGKPSRVKGKD